MQIAFVSIETVFHRDTETNRRLQTIAETLALRDHDVHLFCSQFWSGTRDRLERDEITYHAVCDSVEATRTFLLRLPVALALSRPDIVHASARPPDQVRAADWGATLARAPLVVEWYGEDGIPDDRPTRQTASRADWIVTPSELVGTWVRERGADGDIVESIPNAIDIDRIRAVEPADPVDVIYARRLDSGANLESLLLALAELRNLDWQATIIGDGPDREMYERLARDLRIDHQVSFVGECDRDERIAAYRGAHVFAQTAEHCVFPTELLWAIAAGCVGIVEYHVDSSAHELVEGWDRGFRTTSEAELVDAILGAGDLEYRQLDDHFTGYDSDAVTDRYLDRYRALVADKGLF